MSGLIIDTFTQKHVCIFTDWAPVICNGTYSHTGTWTHSHVHFTHTSTYSYLHSQKELRCIYVYQFQIHLFLQQTKEKLSKMDIATSMYHTDTMNWE